MAAQGLPDVVLSVWIPVSTALLSLGSMLCTARITAMAEAAVPHDQRGRQLALLQYSLAAAQISAPLLGGLLASNPTLPWLILLAASLSALMLLRWLAPRLGAAATSAGAGPAE